MSSQAAWKIRSYPGKRKRHGDFALDAVAPASLYPTAQCQQEAIRGRHLAQWLISLPGMPVFHI